MIGKFIGSFLRHLLTFGGGSVFGFLTANGFTDSEAEAVVAAVVTLAGAAWSGWEKYKSSKEQKQLEEKIENLQPQKETITWNE